MNIFCTRAAMNIICASLLSLLCVGWAEAEPLASPNAQYQQDEFQFDALGYLKVTKESIDKLLRDHPDAYLRVRVMDEPCLGKMEAVMEKMDNYLPSKVATFTLEVATAMIYGKATNKSLHQMTPIYEDVERQWNDAKRDCWQSGR